MKRLSIFNLLLFFICFQAKAQYVLINADKQFELFNYTKAIDLYEQAYKKKASLYAAEQLAMCFKLNNDYMQAENWYSIAITYKNSKAENTLNYAIALQNNSKYSEAKNQYLNYIKLNPKVSDKLKNVWLSSCDSALVWMKNPKPLNIFNAKNLNSSESDWAAVKYLDGTVFSSDRKNFNIQDSENKAFLRFDKAVEKPNEKIYGWTGNNYLKLYYQENKINAINLFPFNAETNYHVASPSFTADGNIMYFTLTKISKKSENKKISTINVEIFSTTKNDQGNWSKPQSFKFNNVNAYSLGDPFISADGKKLYFSSNMPGGLGGSDIYVSHKLLNGEWDKPTNLVDINTEGNERSPAESIDNNFYFASDGRIGMGGLDVFKSKLINNKFSAVENMGYPFNSPQDDFAIGLDYSGKIIFLSSNRTGGLGSDDIYNLTESENLILKLNGVVFNKVTNLPLANAIVSLTKINGEKLKVETDSIGRFSFNLEKANDYNLLGEKTDFKSDGLTFSTKDLITTTSINKNLYLDLIVLDKAIRLENIYYNFDKWNIRADAKIELDKLVAILIENPTIWIELGSHTDSRGNDNYNQILSQKRAESAVQYIVSKGINKNRISAKGYGESKLLNKCSNGVKCTPEAHQLNRRTEFKIVKK